MFKAVDSMAHRPHPPASTPDAAAGERPASPLDRLVVLGLTRASSGGRFEELRRLQVERLGNRPPLDRVREELPMLGAAVVLATCCRFEVHGLLKPGESNASAESLALGMERLLGIESSALPSPVQVTRGEAALRHWLWTAIGGDSILPGETEILGQLKTAYRHAHADDALTDAALLHEVYQRGFRIVHRLRLQHFAGGGLSTSLPRLALERMRALWDESAADPFGLGKHLAIVGAGQVSLQVAAWCIRAGMDAGRITFYVRNEERARARAGFPQRSVTRLIIDLAGDLAQCPPDGLFGAVTHPLHGLDSPKAWSAVTASFPVVDLSVPAMVSPATQSALPAGVRYVNFEALMGEQSRRARQMSERLDLVELEIELAALSLGNRLAARQRRRAEVCGSGM